ncbi:MAG: hypothetical protein O2954_08835 [bacterium]|nr:hypothetical protein [bacterium]
MQIAYLILFALSLVVPILLAWLKGDQILNYIAARRQQRQRRRRQKSTRALPVREHALQTLLDAEDIRDRIDAQIGDTLEAFQKLSHSTMLSRDTTPTIDHMEKHLLSRESHFNAYLDVAWLQSEAIVVLTQEVELLREVAGVSLTHLEEIEPATPPSPSSATQRLFQNLNSATKKRAAVDRRLHTLGATTPEPPPSPSTRFDATVE